MTEEISTEKRMELYLDTLQKCGMYLLGEEDKVIEYNIFEEFDIGVVSFLHLDNLVTLKDAGLINDKIMEKSHMLGKMVEDLRNSNEWSTEGVKNSFKWRKILALTDEIKSMLE